MEPSRGARGVIHIVERMAPGGIETLVLDLVRGGAGRDAIFSLQATRSELAGRWTTLHDLDGALEGFGRKPGIHPGLSVALALRLADLRPRAVFVHHMGPLLYGGAAAMLARVPRLVHVEHDAWHYAEAGSRTLMRWCARAFRPKLVAVSDQVARTLGEIVPGRAIRVVAPGIDTERFLPASRREARRRLGCDPDATLVGSAGRLVPVKGHVHLIDALASLPATVKAVIAGDGPERDALLGRAAERGVADRLHLLGHRDDLETFYPALDLFCLPSLAEGLPRTVLEAQSCGVPVAASDVGGLQQAICPSSGRLVPAGDPARLAAAILDLLGRDHDPASTRSFVVERFSWSQTLAAYRELGEVTPWH